MSFAEINQAIPVTEVRMLYTPYHEMDVRQFVDKMNELYREAKPETNLKELRTFANLSQSELAQQAGVSVRTIQQYEQRRKDINKAQTETFFWMWGGELCRKKRKRGEKFQLDKMNKKFFVQSFRKRHKLFPRTKL